MPYLVSGLPIIPMVARNDFLAPALVTRHNGPWLAAHIVRLMLNAQIYLL